MLSKKKNWKLLKEIIEPEIKPSANNNITINTSTNENWQEYDFQNSIFKLSYSDFEPLKLIGRGSFGEVILVRLKVNKKLYAMKIFDKEELKKRKQQIHTKTERDLMVKINCPFIVNIKSAFQDEAKLYIVSELLQGGDLYFHLHEKRNLVFSEKKLNFMLLN